MMPEPNVVESLLLSQWLSNGLLVSYRETSQKNSFSQNRIFCFLARLPRIRLKSLKRRHSSDVLMAISIL